MELDDVKVRIVDYSQINKEISDYANQPHNLSVERKFSAFIESEDGEFALLSDNLEIRLADLKQYEVRELKESEGEDLEVNPEFDILLDKENDTNSKYRFTVLLSSLQEAPYVEVPIKEYLVPGTVEVEEEKVNAFRDWYFKN